MDPMFFSGVYKDYIWGGTNLKKNFNKISDLDKIAESWEVSATKNNESTIINGDYKGIKLDELFSNEQIKEEIFGTLNVNNNNYQLKKGVSFMIPSNLGKYKLEGKMQIIKSYI